MEKKKYGWLNHDLIITAEKAFVKRMFVLENMRTCIVQWGRNEVRYEYFQISGVFENRGLR